jgi:acetylornithine deacetylase/succinyl-diaminopimelate desuccinylase-like protein
MNVIDRLAACVALPSPTPPGRVAEAGRPAARATGFNAGCDLSKLVGAGLPTVICGPGSFAEAHRPDESVPLHEVTDAVAGYEGIARRLLSPGA